MRPEVAASVADHELLPTPRRMGAFPLLRVALRAGVSCKPVPPEHYRRASSLAGYEQVVVDCVCGATVIADLAYAPVPCGGCTRWFFYAGPQVLALLTPAT